MVLCLCSGDKKWFKVGFNFGNGYFGSTAIFSEGTNASGNGKFEYDVPTGYTALSTKGLNDIMAYTNINNSSLHFNT